MKKTSTHHVASNEVVSAAEATAPSHPAAPGAAAPPPPPAPVTSMADPAVKQCLALLDQVLVLLGGGDPLSALEIQHSTKMRKGGAEVIPKILALCQQHRVTTIGSLSTQEMSDELERGNALHQVGVKIGLVQKKAKDGALGAYGRSWQIGTTMYTTLQRLAVDDPELAVGLQPVQDFFQTKRTKGKVRENRRQRALKKLAHQAGAITASLAAGTGGGAAEQPAAAPAPAPHPAPAPEGAAAATSAQTPSGQGH